MKHYVENKGFAKFFRTLGYILVLFGVTLTALELVFSESANFILLDTMRSLLEPVQAFVSELTFLEGTTYVFVSFGLGLTLLVLTLKKTVFARFVYGLVVLYAVAILIYANTNLVLPIDVVNPTWLTDIVNFGSVAFDPVLELSSEFAVPLISLLLVLVLWQTFATKKPKRFATTLNRIGFAVLFVAVLTYFAAIAFEGGFFSSDIYSTIQAYAYFIAFDFIAVGSVFGVLGLFRK